MMYNKTIKDYFFSPRHAGVIDLSRDFTVFVKNAQKGQGLIEFYLQCEPDGIIQRACFKTNGNPYLIAGLEWLCRQLEQQSIDKVLTIDFQLLIKELEIPVAQSPLALRIANVFKDVLILMKNKLIEV